MKRFSSLIYLPLIASILFSCEKEVVEPSLTAATEAGASAPYCQDYSYYNKPAGGTVVLGKASANMILVGFPEGLSMQARQQLLGRYPLFHSISGEVAGETGTITLVKLQNGGSCSETEKLLEKLLRESLVKFAYPFFENGDPNAEQSGLSNEFIVFLDETGTIGQLEKLVADTKTNLAISYDEQFHLITVNKNSTGHILQIISKFNQQSFIYGAEPNLVVSLPNETMAVQAESFQTSKVLKKGTFDMLKVQKLKTK